MELLEMCQTPVVAPRSVPEIVKRGAKYLPALDQRLLHLTWRGVFTTREIAMLVGLSPGTVVRRKRRLLNRLASPIVGAVVENGALLPEGYGEVALAFHLRGEPMVAIARTYGMPKGEVKRILAYVRGWCGARRQ